MSGGPAQAVESGTRVIVQKVDQLTLSGLDRGVALNRWLFAARYNHFELRARIIEVLNGFERCDPALAGSRRDDDSDGWQPIAHRSEATAESSRWKLKTRKPGRCVLTPQNNGRK